MESSYVEEDYNTRNTVGIASNHQNIPFGLLQKKKCQQKHLEIPSFFN